jgi:hypothetical protein
MLKGIQNELLMILDFDLMALTPYHVLNQLFASGVILTCDNKQSGKELSERTFKKVREYAFFFCEVVNEEYSIIQRYLPSKVAAACLYLARKCCRLR